MYEVTITPTATFVAVRNEYLEVFLKYRKNKNYKWEI